jgi:hypothetical protein
MFTSIEICRKCFPSFLGMAPVQSKHLKEGGRINRQWSGADMEDAMEAVRGGMKKATVLYCTIINK